MSMTVSQPSIIFGTNGISYGKLVVLFSSSDPDERFNTVTELAERTDPDDIPPLHSCLDHEDSLVVRCAISALGYRGDKSSEEKLLRRLYDHDEGVRTYAVSALGKIMGKDATGPLLELSIKDPSNDVFYQIAETLLELECPEVVEALVKYMCSNIDNQLALIRLPALLDLFSPAVKNEGIQRAFSDNEIMSRFSALVQLGLVRIS
jgi:HEAT repeat protein